MGARAGSVRAAALAAASVRHSLRTTHRYALSRDSTTFCKHISEGDARDALYGFCVAVRRGVCRSTPRKPQSRSPSHNAVLPLSHVANAAKVTSFAAFPCL